MKVTEYDPSKAIPNLAGKVIFVTGGTSGLGYQTILQYTQHNPGHIVFTGRNQSAADKLIIATQLGDRISFIQCDLSSLASVKRCTQAFLSRFDRLDILIENAGINGLGVPSEVTADGYEKVWQVNYLAHALLDTLLLPLLLRTAESGADVRLVIVSSKLHATTLKGGIDYTTLDDGAAYTSYLGSAKRYGQSKLGNLLRADELARRYPALTAVSLHPGIVSTEMNRNMPWLTKIVLKLFVPLLPPNQGAFNQLWATTAPKGQVESGSYYDPVGEKAKRSTYADKATAETLWVYTEEELKRWL